ncbi:MAG: tyrosine-type recombinase/integrase, partial [Tepidisphaeraceae bacterium]
MASLSHDGGRKWRVQTGADAGRKTIRYRGSKMDAERFRDRVERLALAQQQGEQPQADLIEWLAKMPDAMHARILKAELTKPRQRSTHTLKELLDAYFAHLDVKPITSLGYQATRKALLSHFGTDRDIANIEPIQAEQWRSKMKADGLAQATISKRIGIAKHVFKHAVTWKWFGENPFAGVKAGSQQNRSRQFFITLEMATKIIDKCPSLEWKLIFALSRFGGLRCPSEHAALRWGDIDFEHNRIRVTCSKTEHHAGRGERFVPIFPELRPLLLDAFSEAAEGTEHVLPRIRGTATNLRTTFT